MGELYGLVIDQSGAPLGGVRIVLESDVLVRQMADVTTADGRYEFPIVPTGTYDVSFELTGFKKVVRANVIIEPGFVAEVNATLGAPLPELPTDAAQLIGGFETDRAAIQSQADQRIEARRRVLAGQLEALLDQYTKAGRLDEAVAIRDYLRSLTGGGQ